MQTPNSEESPESGGRADEFALIERLREGFESARGPSIRPGDLWIGDDAAAVTLPHPGRVVLATDLVVDGVHVDAALCTPEDIGWKALMVTVSDLGAMGADVSFALLSVAAPVGFAIERLGAGVAEAAACMGCAVVGGDLSTSPVLVVSVTAVGSVPDDGHALLRRDGARAGDHLFVTGPLGGSSAGLRLLRGGDPGDSGVLPSELAAAYRRPVARMVEGSVARRAGATACIDISDGLLADLVHVAKASGVGLDLAVGDSVVVAGATRHEALAGGEEYELVLTTPDPDGLVEAFRAAGLRAPMAIGRCTGEGGVYSLDGGPLPEGGWRHQF